jgi:hypothetical protein
MMLVEDLVRCRGPILPNGPIHRRFADGAEDTPPYIPDSSAIPGRRATIPTRIDSAEPALHDGGGIFGAIGGCEK